MKLNAEWIDYMNAYRLYNPEHPQETIAYEDDLENARNKAIEERYEFIEPEIDWTKIAVDTPILVKDLIEGVWFKRYFAKYENGFVYAWDGGKTSSTTDMTWYWKYAKLA